MKKTVLIVFLISVLVAIGIFMVWGAPKEGSPVYIEGNPSCVSLWFVYWFKFDPPVPWTYSFGGGTFTWQVSSTGVISWNSTFGVDAVLVKWWPNAYLYEYDPESFADTGLTTPINPNNGTPYGISHIDVCYDYEVHVTKTAMPFFTREYLWSLNKQGSSTWMSLLVGATWVVHYTVTAQSTWYLDSDRWATGTITIDNPDPTYAASITQVHEQLSWANISCSHSLPYVLPSLQSLSCTYALSFPDGLARINIVSVETTGNVGGWSWSAAIAFLTPTTVLDETVALYDSRIWFLWTGVFGTAFVANYSALVGPYTLPGTYSFDNVATLLTLDTAKSILAPYSFPVLVTSLPSLSWCTYTQWYWKTQSKYGPGKGRLPRGIGSWEDANFYLSNQSWYQVLVQVPKGNPYYILAHQYIAAILNNLSGAPVPSEVSWIISLSTSFFSTMTPTSVLTKLQKTQLTNYANILDRYNSGLVGPWHCDDE